MTDIHSVALLGAGRIGSIHAANIAAHDRSRLAYVVDPNRGAAEMLAARYGAGLADADTAMDDPDIAAIVICSATPTHADFIERAAKAGKAVFCEKPIDLSQTRVRETLQAIEGSGAPLLVAFNRRFDPGLAALHRSVRAGEIGSVELVTVVSKDPGPPPIPYIKESGGLFRDMTIHDLDMARFLLGEEPTHVHAAASNLVDPEIGEAGDIDTAVLTLETASGRLAVITNSRRAVHGYDQRVEVHGSKGTLRTVNMPESTLVRDGEGGIVHAKPMHFFLERYAAAYRAEWDHFVDVLDGNAAPLANGEDGLRALVLADAAYGSLESGARVAIPA